MLLKIYLGTTIVSLGTAFVSSAACKEKLKRKGYKVVNSKKSFAEKLASFMSTVMIGAIPVYNIINTIAILYMGDKLYDYMEKDLLKEGKIYMPNNESINAESEMESSPVEKSVITHSNDIKKARSEKSNDEMTTEERIAYLETEKEKLLEWSHQKKIMKYTRKRF